MGLQSRCQPGIQSSKGLPGARRLASRIASSLDYGKEAPVPYHVGLFIGLFGLLTTWLLVSPECVIQGIEPGGIHNALYVLVLNVTHCHLCHMLFIGQITKHSSHLRGEGLGSTF